MAQNIKVSRFIDVIIKNSEVSPSCTTALDASVNSLGLRDDLIYFIDSFMCRGSSHWKVICTLDLSKLGINEKMKTQRSHQSKKVAKELASSDMLSEIRKRFSASSNHNPGISLWIGPKKDEIEKKIDCDSSLYDISGFKANLNLNTPIDPSCCFITEGLPCGYTIDNLRELAKKHKVFVCAKKEEAAPFLEISNWINGVSQD